MISPEDKARIALGAMGLFVLVYGLDAARKGVFAMAIRNLPRTVEIRRSDKPLRFWTYVCLFVVLGIVLLGRAWTGGPS